MQAYLWIGLGGALGSMARHWSNGLIAVLAGVDFPWGTLVINVLGSFIIGIAAGVIPFLACTKLKAAFGYDDALDTFGVHAVGGTVGTVMAGVLASAEVNPNLLADRIHPLVSKTLWLEQVKAGGLILVGSVVVTVVLYKVLDVTIGCRASEDVERQGLDLAEHGEEGYHG